jgi:K+-sensing histidine kinase KdpD
MLQLIQALWDQMRTDLRADAMPQVVDACQTLQSGTLGPLTEHQTEDLESIQRSFDKLAKRVNGEPINWADYSEAAHALRGPLNSTIGFSRLMLKGLEGPITEAQSKELETIFNVSRQMLVIFNLLLDALLLNGKDMSFNIEAMRVNEVLDELISVGQLLADNRDFTFETDLTAPVAEITLQSDQKRLKQALSALLAVSGKHTSGGVLTLRAWPGEAGLMIRLESQGCRLPAPLPADLSRLLTDEADCSLPYDAHLRLGLAWRLLTEMGGGMEIHQDGETCTFAVTLPTAVDHEML